MDLEQQRIMRDNLKASLPKMLQVGQAYGQAYPPNITASAVLDAVTVPVPLRFFMTTLAFLSTEFGVIDGEQTPAAAEREEETHL
jgi:hypothetical protein